MNVSETLVHHASDWIDWIDASGSLVQERRITAPLQIFLSEAPSDLTMVLQNGRSRLWRRDQDDLHRSIPGRASETQLAYPTGSTFNLAGEVHDPQKQFNPRLFSLTPGNAAGQSLEMFRSPMGTRFASAGGLRGNVRFEDDSPASWAVLRIEVTPLVGPLLTFRAQADLHGDFVLAMDRLPALAKDISPQHYNAQLSATALVAASGAELSNPDDFVSAQIQSIDDSAVFATSIDLTVSPGTVHTLTSKDQSHLVLRIP